MGWFTRKPRRPRGPATPQARALNWRLFLEESERDLRDAGVPPASWAEQETFQEFLKSGIAPSGPWHPATAKDRDRFRTIVWRYRDRMKLRFGTSFIEREDEPPRYTTADVLHELRKSTRWGAGEQPDNVEEMARVFATLPLFTVDMKSEDTLILRFVRPLTEAESRRMLQVVGSDAGDEEPFVPGEPKLIAFFKWD